MRSSWLVIALGIICLAASSDQKNANSSNDFDPFALPYPGPLPYALPYPDHNATREHYSLKKLFYPGPGEKLNSCGIDLPVLY